MSRLKLFISAYACEPELGSEIGVGWHWTLELSKYFEVWILTRRSNQHSIEKWLDDNPSHSDLHFLYYDLPKWARFWKKGLRGVHFYYYLWQIFSNRLVADTMQRNDIEIFHHLTYGNALWNVSRYGQNKCFIWGPIGGLESISSEYSRYYDLKSRIKEWVRRAIAHSIRWNISFGRRCKKANLIFCKTLITQEKIPAKYRNKSELFTDVAIDSNLNLTSEVSEHNDVNYLMVGRLDPWRGFDFAIEAFAKAKKHNPEIQLNIVGSGIDKQRLQELIHSKQLDGSVILHGKVDKAEYENLLNKADVVINASLKEGAVTLSFDAVACGKPLICIDTTGHTSLLSNCAIVLPQSGRDSTIQILANTISELVDPKKRIELKAKALENSEAFIWDKRGMLARDMIMKAYEKYCMETHRNEK